MFLGLIPRKNQNMVLRKVDTEKVMNHVINDDATAGENYSHINVSSLTSGKNQEQIIKGYHSRDDWKGC